MVILEVGNTLERVSAWKRLIGEANGGSDPGMSGFQLRQLAQCRHLPAGRTEGKVG